LIILNRTMNIFINPDRKNWKEILARPEINNADLRMQVASLLNEVRSGGDRKLIELTERFDGVKIPGIQISGEDINSSINFISPELIKSIGIARHNIEKYHAVNGKADSPIETSAGVSCWSRTLPVEKVGLYIPGGTAPLFSTVLMLGIPARIAGCNEIILCTPPGPDGSIHPSILYCAHILGIEKVFRVGGAQAIAAMAFGTETIPAVDKIFGPGNRFVMVAKQLVSLENVAIDMPAGPSEVAVIADDTADPAFVAADLIAQAEHGPDSQVLLVSTDPGLAEKIEVEIDLQLSVLPRREIAEKALNNSRMVVMEKRADIPDIINSYAPEHLIIMCRDYAGIGNQIKSAGSVFMGHFTPESAGDYASGTNHTLPTGGYASVRGGLELRDFQKRISFQEISQEGLQNLGPTIMCMAKEEKLSGHSFAVEVRLNKISGKQA